MRWRFTVIVCILLLLTMLPLAAAANGAAVLIEPLDFTLDSSDPFYPGESGEGWAWDEGTDTLTLSGINLEVGLEEESFAIKLPDGAEIVLAAGTDNSVSNSYDDAIYGEGSLVITGGGNLTVVGCNEGVYTDYNNRGDLSFVGCGNISVTSTDYYSIDAYGDISINGCSRVYSSSHFSAIWADGGVSISDCGEVDLHGMHSDGISADGDVSISGCGKLTVLTGKQYAGIWADGSVSIMGCPDVNIKANIETDDDDGPNIEGVENGVIGGIEDGYGIVADNGPVTISSSRVEIYGARFGITTWYGWELAGGDVIIDHSYVHACCDENGYAAIFAGDDLPYGEGEHARIVFNGCVITSPSAGLVLDVNIEQGSGDLNCQSITDLDGTWIITNWDQAARDVTIEPLAAYTLTYDANGGSGSVADANSPYSAGATVTVLPNAFTAPAGKTFTGWNTKADGSGTAYAPGAAFAIAGNTVLYAQYSAIPVFTVTFNSQGGGAVAALTVHANSTINAPAPPVRSGHTFGGWYKDKECKNAWNFATDRITGNTTLYARWTLTEPTPPSSGQGYAFMGFIIAGCLLGGLFLLIRHRQHA